ncbi:nucleotidyl transferase AbiEii/AbiGii toxin family protein, partial [Sphaerisporangium sp. NPDC049003]|uniref:nucleotidyl transferase AbiEii/AbiGii toxin family protein n=1 Tax=Sphaerisporangium sp. NPDC049003 TaxID=3364517 RepID=UPI0037242EF3
MTPGLVFRSFYFSRLAARVFRHDPSGWILKGGQALLLRYPAQARLSRDIDLQRPTAQSAQEALNALFDAVAGQAYGTTEGGFLPRAWDHPVASDGTTPRV